MDSKLLRSNLVTTVNGPLAPSALGVVDAHNHVPTIRKLLGRNVAGRLAGNIEGLNTTEMESC